MSTNEQFDVIIKKRQEIAAEVQKAIDLLMPLGLVPSDEGMELRALVAELTRHQVLYVLETQTAIEYHDHVAHLEERQHGGPLQ